MAAAEADAQNALAISQDESVPRSLRAEVHQTTAGLSGRDRSIDVSAEHHERMLAELKAAHTSKSRAYVHALISAADADITAVVLDRGAGRLEEAARLRTTWFADDAHVQTELLAVEGRLDLHRTFAGDNTRLGTARAKLSEAVALLRSEKGVRCKGLAAALINLSHVYALSDDITAAIRLSAEAYQLDVKRYGADHAETLLDKQILDSFRAAKRSRTALGPSMRNVANELRRGERRRPADPNARTDEDRISLKLADTLERVLGERARPSGDSQPGNLSRVPDVVQLPPQRKLHPMVLGANAGLLLDLNVGDDDEATSTILDALAEAGLPRVANLDTYLPSPPNGWNFVLWPTLTPSERFADARSSLLSDAAWDASREDTCRALSLPAEPDAFIEQLAADVDDACQRTRQALTPEHAIDDLAARGELPVERLDALPSRHR